MSKHIDKREATRDAARKIEDILEDLEINHDVRVHNIDVLSSPGDEPLINLVPDRRGGSL